tara:strand:+ start:2215 stop:3279 length:1065 start_codon:yes stop_codon:yes gene_type:complete
MSIKKSYKTSFSKKLSFVFIIIFLFFLIFEFFSRLFVFSITKNYKTFQYGFNKNIKIDILHLVKFEIKITDLKLLNSSIKINKKRNINKENIDSRIWAFGGSTTKGKNCGTNSSSWVNELSNLNQNLKTTNFAKNGVDSYWSLKKMQENIVKLKHNPDIIIWAHKFNEINIIYQGVRKNYNDLETTKVNKNNRKLFFQILRIDKTFKNNFIFYKFFKNIIITSNRKIIRTLSNERINFNLTEDDFKYAANNFEINTLKAINLSKRIGSKKFFILSLPSEKQYEKKMKKLFFQHYKNSVEKLSMNKHVVFVDLSNHSSFEDNTNKLFCDEMHKTLKANIILSKLIEPYVNKYIND